MSQNEDDNFLDAGVFIGALRRSDPRSSEAFPIIEAAQRGELTACTSVSVLSEVYAALTWVGAQPPLLPAQASAALVRLLEPPSALRILPDGLEAALLHLQLAAKHTLTARRIHDARHAATALQNGIVRVYTYDAEDWSDFTADGITIVGPSSTLMRLAPSVAPQSGDPTT